VQTRADRPTDEDVLAVVRAALALVLEVDPATVDRGTAFEALDADSLALVEVAEIVEESLAPVAGNGFHIPDADLEALTTVGDAVDYALARL
jgi:acyl carrier protein